MAHVAFIGLGVMGGPMAGHLLKAGHTVRAYNRSAGRSAAWSALHGAPTVETIGAAAREADAVLMCVGADADVRSVFDAALPAMKRGAAIVDHTTASAALARTLAEESKAAGVEFIDAPVSGGQAGAEQGRLSVMAGGSEGAVDMVRPIMSAYAASIVHVGPTGSGQLAKMVNQIAIAGVLQGLAEALAFAERAGLDIPQTIAAVSRGAAQSWQLDNRWRTMTAREFEFGFAVDWMRKDLGLALDEAKRNGADLSFTKLVDANYAEVQAMGGGRWDTSSLVARLQR